ncbi:MAG: hypothetical protein R3242_11570 [Akkermansiaceae bacterium]|nr:hypothetical protein [Akkermansiaceae bacterium]
MALSLTLAGLSSCANMGNQDGGEGSESQAIVHRSFGPPSGDWLMHIDYSYNDEGELELAHSTLNTFQTASATEPESDGRLTIIERIYTVNADGELELLKQTIRDEATGEEVERGFHDPEVKHWMTMEEAEREKVIEMEAMRKMMEDL